MSGAGDGEDVIHQGPYGPMSRLEQGYGRRAKTQLALAEGGARSGGKDHRRPEAPDQLAWFWRREKEGRVHISETVFSAGVRARCGLPHDRLDDPRDDHPFFVEMRGKHRLNV